MKCVNDFLGDVFPVDAAAVLLIEVDGALSATEAEAKQVLGICQEANAINVQLAKDSQEAMRLANSRRAALPALSRLKPTTILEDVSVPPSRLGEMLDEIDIIRSEYKLGIGVFGHAGDGNLHPTILTDERNQEEMARVHQAAAKIFEKAISLGGTISGEHGIGTSKMAYLSLQYRKPTLQIMKHIKQCLDPDNIFNPGKMFTENDESQNG
jgi:glycolate oxidase